VPDPVIHRWTHPSVILVPTDLSDTERLMPYALQQAESTGAHLLLLHVLAAGESMAVDAVGMPYYDPAGAIDTAGQMLHSCCLAARSQNIPCEALVREGNTAQQVITTARQFHADRILLGTRSRGKVSKLLLGSVAEQVLRSAHIPVMTVGPEAHLAVDVANPNSEGGVVLHATTLREASRPSAALACRIAAQHNRKLVLLHVLPPADEMERQGLPTGADSIALRELRIIAAETANHATTHTSVADTSSGDSFACCPIPIETHVVHGNPAIEILAEAADLRASLIVLGATQRNALQNLTRERTIYKVLAHARCPVLTLREPKAEPEQAVLARLAAHR
jgi:nucleotide-binding universal stress UspA family protein